MNQNELPTFRRWGEIILRWKRVSLLAVFVICVHIIGTHFLKRYYAVIEPCEQPCQDGITCSPLDFSFEISPAKIKLGQPVYLWYRARITNRSCRELAPISVNGFLDSTELRKSASSLWVTVTDPDGREIERLPLPQADGGIAWNYGVAVGVDFSSGGTIHPYQPNNERIRHLSESGVLKGSGYVTLSPGETFETVTPILRPYRIIATSVRDKDGGLGQGYRWDSVENPPAFPTPPEGFNLLDRFEFKKPGRYTIRAGFNGEIGIFPVFTRWENRHRWLDVLFWPTHPSGLDSKRRLVDLIAPSVVIEAVK